MNVLRSLSLSYRPFLVVLYFFAIFTAPCLAQTSAPDAKKEKLRIGALLSLTGQLSHFGEAARRGIELAVSESNNSIEVVFQDDLSGDRAATAAGARQMIEVAGVNALLVTGLPSLEVLAPAYGNRRIPIISLWDANSRIEQLPPNCFGIGYSNEVTGAQLATFARKTLGLKQVAIVSAHDEWSELIASAFEGELIATGGAAPLKAAVGLDDTDHRSLVTRILRSNADGVYFPLYRASLAALIKQLKQQGFKGAMLTAEGLSTNEISELGPLTDEIYFTQSSVSDLEFEARCLKHFGGYNPKLNLSHTALGYDATKLLEVAAGRGGDLLDQLRQVKIQGIGGEISFQSSRSLKRGQSIFRVDSGQFRQVTE